MSRRAPKVKIVNPMPTESAAISAILTELSGRARVLDSLRNCLVCMSCFKLADNCHVEWKSGDLICSHCSAEKHHVVDMDKVVKTANAVAKAVAKVAKVARLGRHGVVAATAAPAHEAEEEEEEGEEEEEEDDSEEEGEDDEDDDSETADPPKNVLSHPKLRVLEAAFKKQKMYSGIVSTVTETSFSRSKRAESTGRRLVQDGEEENAPIRTSKGGPLEKIRELSNILKHGFTNMKPPRVAEATTKSKEASQEKPAEGESKKETMVVEKEVGGGAVPLPVGLVLSVPLGGESNRPPPHMTMLDLARVEQDEQAPVLRATTGSRGTPVNGW